jgi:hypothetical protein
MRHRAAVLHDADSHVTPPCSEDRAESAEDLWTQCSGNCSAALEKKEVLHMKAYGLLALAVTLSLPTVGTPARAETISEELRHFFHERHEEFREDAEGVREIAFRLHRLCDGGDRHACVHLGVLIGENKEHREEWRRAHPEMFSWL